MKVYADSSNQQTSLYSSVNQGLVVRGDWLMVQFIFMVGQYVLIYFIVLTPMTIIPTIIVSVINYCVGYRHTAVLLNIKSETHSSAEEKLSLVKQEKGRLWDQAHCHHSESYRDSDGNQRTRTVTRHIEKSYFNFDYSTDETCNHSPEFHSRSIVCVSYATTVKFDSVFTSDAVEAHRLAFQTSHRSCDRERTFTSGVSFDNLPNEKFFVASPSCDIESLKILARVSLVLGISFFVGLWMYTKVHSETITVRKTITKLPPGRVYEIPQMAIATVVVQPMEMMMPQQKLVGGYATYSAVPVVVAEQHYEV